ncbi:MAG TPA: TonB-dependent receptor [Bacteroidetes bacterium]|nr:TonB-dependent receptor [Bacteroidota bacterium]
MKMKKKMKKAAAVGFLLIFNLSVAGLSFLHASAYGLPQQQITVQGKVVDAQNLPVPGASVLLKGTMTGTITDTDGYYSLTIGADVQNPVLVFSFVGMVTQEIAVGGRSTINVTMVEDVVSLDEVVAIGYGSVKKSDITGAVSSVNTEEALKAPVANVEQILQGRAAGVLVTSTSNAPGGGATIRIRGGNSITAGNEPLYVIDGFIGGGNLTSISPSDIESIEILKDASSTAIYGTRGANGVVLITTKRGKVGRPTVTVNTSHGWQKVAGQVDARNQRQFAEFYNQGALNIGIEPIYDLDNLPEGTNWQEVGLREAYVTDNNVSVQGGNELTQYYVSGNFFKQEGIILSNEFDRYNLNFNIDQKVSDHVKISLHQRYNHSYTDNPKYSAGQLVLLNPLLPVKDENGDYTYMWESGVLFNNPIASANMDTNESFADRLLTIGNIELKFFPWLKLKSSLSYDKVFNKTQVYLPGAKPNRAAQNLGGYGSISKNEQTTFLNENLLNFEKEFSNSNLNAVLGLTMQTFQGESSFISGEKLLNDVTKFYALEFTEAEYRTISSGYNEWSILSMLGRVNYSLYNKYLFTVSFRRDGSSRLGANNKWANFPSAAFAWRLSEEPFIKDLGIFHNLKLRTSYGVTGNQGIPTFTTLARLGTYQGIVNDTQYTGVIQGTLANPNIRWETTRQFDVGLNAGFFDNRLSFEFDYYYKKTFDLLFEEEVPYYTGFTSQLRNVGSLQNHGFEAVVDAVVVSNQDFTWQVSANVAQYRNEILELGSKDSIETHRLPAPSRALTGRLIEGQPLGIFVGYEVEGVDPETGDFTFVDQNDDGVIDELDETIIGNSNPKFFGGIQNTLRYKNVELSLFFQGVYGNDLYNTRLYNSSSMEVAGHELNSYASITKDQWTVDNPEGAKWPGAGIANNILAYSNSSFIFNGSYLRLKTLQLSYTIPKIGNLFRSARIYFTGTNLFLLKDKDYLDYDPEVNTYGSNDVLRGYTNVVYPNNKSYVFGINLIF